MPEDAEQQRQSGAGARVPDAVVERFFRRVVKTDDCWIWTGAVSSPDGYGRMTFNVNGKPRTVAAHRLALMIERGRMDVRFVAEHHCNEPLCVRADPGHVHASTQTDNLRYAVECGRADGPRMTVDSRQRYARSLAVRNLARSDFSERAYQDIMARYSKPANSEDQMRLF